MITTQEHIDSGLYPKDIKDAVERWDRGETVWSVEMGGLGPGYEQAIQIGMIEVLRRLIGHEIPTGDTDWSDFLAPYISEVSKEFNLQLSGSQAGAIAQLVCKFITKGWIAVDDVRDRMIQISKAWPGKKKDE